VPSEVTLAFLTLAAARLGMSREQALAHAAELLERFTRADRVVVVEGSVETTVMQRAAQSPPAAPPAPGGES
jgi:hypothetical protein